MSAPRIPNSEQYWLDKGKDGKKVVIYFHDDLDGIFSAVVIRNYLVNKGFEIIAYGVVNYNDGWQNIDINDEHINVAVDFAENHSSMDIYIDHHGEAYGEDNQSFAIKTNTCSAYEGICYQLGIPVDSLVMEAIDMVDSAKYEDYGLSFRDVLYYDLKEFTRTEKPKLHYTASMNQFIKRGCWKTLIEVVHNTEDISVYKIFDNFKKFYPGNNLWRNSDKEKDFIEDGHWRLGEMRSRTRGVFDTTKPVYTSQQHFIDGCWNTNKTWEISGYQIIGRIAFIPSGTWANALRARAILEEDIEKGIVPEDQVDFILLQYGSTLQMVCFSKIGDLPEERYPILKGGIKMTNIGKYMTSILDNMKEHVYYTDISTFIGSDDDVTKSGGHGGIGSISNIIGKCKEGVFEDVKYLDLIKNKIMQDISGIEWNSMKMFWSDKDSSGSNTEVNRYLKVEDIRNHNDL